MNPPKEHWIVTTDLHAARVLRLTHTPQGTLHVEERAALQNKHTGLQEHHRPTILGSGPATMPPHTADVGHEAQEDARRFAHDVVQWVTGMVDQLHLDHVTLFAPPRLLGLLRPLLKPHLAARATPVEGDLGGLEPHELAKHPAVAAAARTIARSER